MVAAAGAPVELVLLAEGAAKIRSVGGVGGCCWHVVEVANLSNNEASRFHCPSPTAIDGGE